RTVEAAEPGGPEVLKLAQRPIPACGDNDILIRVAAAGLNRADILQRRGQYPSPPGAPTNPGLEVSGTVVALGAKVSQFKVADKVCALLQGGGYSDFCAVNEGQVLPVPESVSLIEAAALPEACFTVWSNVYEFGRLKRGESLLVHGGSSGIGSFAIQIATALGSEVYATAGSDDKVRFCQKLGALHGINYKTQDFVTAIHERTEGRGVNVILDMVGAQYLERNLQTLATEGRLVMIAAQTGSKANIDLMQIMQRRLVVTGSMLRTRATEFKREIRDKLLTNVWPLLRNGQVKPIVDRAFPFDEASSAHEYMETSAHMGKLILTFSAS
ncbi:MAG: NAD(P)H-quinone oxidoreductase, partial [Povalibacter sp.]